MAQIYGKQINDGWSTFVNMLYYKAEETGNKVILVDPTNTTKMCSNCRAIKNRAKRTYDCSSCGLNINRDLNASINILMRATERHSESNASGDVSMETPMKEEAHTSS